MAISLPELLARFDTAPRGVVGTPAVAGFPAPRLTDISQLLRARASKLIGVKCGGANIPGIIGLALQFVGRDSGNNEECFIKDRVFAVLTAEASLYFRVKQEIADDLVDNALCVHAGKNLLTWPATNAHQLEVVWRLLLHAYWNVSERKPKKLRMLWSESALNLNS